MDRTVLGLETEYGLAVLGRTRSAQQRAWVIERMFDLMRSSMKCLPDQHPNDLFLESAAKCYLDAGDHVEWCTPECTSPWEVARYTLAGDRTLSDLLATVSSDCGGAEISLWRSNVDYVTRATWGTHENIGHACDPQTVWPRLVAHLASRVCYTGAGGFCVGSPGIEFMISPRACFITEETSDSSQCARGIIHTKREALAVGHHRLHLLCGESLCSELGQVLKIGTTALIVAAIDAGRLAGVPVLADSVAAMARFASDPTFRTKALLADGRRMNALEIQRVYLDAVACAAHDEGMPSWGPRLCEYWASTLDALARGPAAVSRSLDWAIKLALFRDHAERSGLGARSLGVCTNAARMQAWPRRPRRREHDVAASLLGLDADELGGFADFEALTETARERRRRTRALRERAAAYLARCGMRVADFARFERLRYELFEIDARFSEVTGEGGLFAALDRAGLLEHRIPEVGDVESARSNAPPGGRAEVRGAWIRELCGSPSARCTWSGVVDSTARVRVQLSDPFARDAVWPRAQPAPALQST